MTNTLIDAAGEVGTAAATLVEALDKLTAEAVNTVTIAGTLARDPEIRYSRQGEANTIMAVALDDAETVFDVVTWHGLAENVALSLVKGSRVVVIGRLTMAIWVDDDDKERTRVEILATEVSASLANATCEISRANRS